MATLELSPGETASCLNADTIRAYLDGAVDEQLVFAIESHLAQCEACERRSRELESVPNSFATSLAKLDQTVAAENERDPLHAAAKLDSPQLVAIQSVKQLAGQVRFAKPEAVPNPELQSFQSLGQYELLEPLGHGGMGVVYRARHRRLAKEVAIKILPRTLGLHPESFRRFEREIAAAGKLDHPAIVRATDAGEEHGVHFLVLELVDGIDLGKLLRQCRQLKIADACEITRLAAIGLEYAHSNGIVHRDIKPSNFMLDRSGQLKILDFGLAQFGPWNPAASELTTVGQLLGTLDYMAPEQASRGSGAVDHRADLYSLGATLYAMLCGHAPYAATPHLSPLEKLRLMATEVPPKPATLRPDLPEELAEFLDSLLQRTVELRPPSAAHVAERIAPFCEGNDLVALIATAGAIPVCGDMYSDVQGAIDLPPGVDRGGTGKANFGEMAVASGASRRSPLSPTIASAAPTKFAGSPPRRRIGALLAWAFFFASAAMGIWLIIETRKGQLVIETDAEVKVKLLADGKEYDSLELHPGANTTRLFAGKYEIELGAGSDRYTLDQNDIRVIRGETVIAKITQKATSAALEQNQSPASTAASKSVLASYRVSGDLDLARRIVETILEGNPNVRLETDEKSSCLIVLATKDIQDAVRMALGRRIVGKTPDEEQIPKTNTYKGKTLDEWVYLLETERELDSLREASSALNSLVTVNDRQKLVDLALAEIRDVRETQPLNDGNSWRVGRMSALSVYTSVLGRLGLNDEQFEQFRQLVVPPADSCSVNILGLMRGAAVWQTLNEQSTAFAEKYIALCRETLNSDQVEAGSEMALMTGSALSTFHSSLLGREQFREQRFIPEIEEFLLQTNKLPADFWFHGRTSIFSQDVAFHIRLTRKFLASDNTSWEAIAVICEFLVARQHALSIDQATEFVQLLDSQLKRFSREDFSSMQRLVDVSDVQVWDGQQRHTQLWVPYLILNNKVRLQFRTSNPQKHPAVNMMLAMSMLGPATRRVLPTEGMQLIIAATSPSRDAFAAEFPSNEPRLGSGLADIHLPELTCENNGRRLKVNPAHIYATIACLVAEQQLEVVTKANESLEASPAGDKSAPTYQGKTLIEWIDVLKKEQDVQMQVNALTVLQKYGTDELGNTLAKTLIEIVPSWSREIQPIPSLSLTRDAIAFEQIEVHGGDWFESFVDQCLDPQVSALASRAASYLSQSRSHANGTLDRNLKKLEGAFDNPQFQANEELIARIALEWLRLARYPGIALDEKSRIVRKIADAAFLNDAFWLGHKWPKVDEAPPGEKPIRDKAYTLIRKSLLAGPDDPMYPQAVMAIEPFLERLDQDEPKLRSILDQQLVRLSSTPETAFCWTPVPYWLVDEDIVDVGRGCKRDKNNLADTQISIPYQLAYLQLRRWMLHGTKPGEMPTAGLIALRATWNKHPGNPEFEFLERFCDAVLAQTQKTSE